MFDLVQHPLYAEIIRSHIIDLIKINKIKIKNII